MPRRDPEARREFDRQRHADPEYRARRNARLRKKYAEDQEYRAKVRAYHDNWRDQNRELVLEHDRQRNKIPERRAKVNAQRQRRYADDPEFRARYQAYQLAYRTKGPVNYNTQRARRQRMGWTPEQEAEHAAKTGCEVCGEPPGKRGLFADHCHGCLAYRGALCHHCNADEGILRKWQAVCPAGSPMRIYMDRHTCEVASEPAA